MRSVGASVRRISRWGLLPLLLMGLVGCSGESSGTKMLNVSYDPTRELYKEYNAAFTAHWRQQTGQDVLVEQSHGGSGKQARAVIDGLQADVVTLALAYDVDAVRTKGGLLADGWAARLPHNSCPYTSTIVFLVRKGNPKNIKDWDDLVRKEVKVVTPDPQTSGGARWNYLAAWGYVLRKEMGDLKKVNDPAQKEALAKAEQKARQYMRALFTNEPHLDSGARAATNSFVQRKIGDVLLAWENEALLSVNQAAGSELEIVVPSISILAEPPVAVVDKVVDQRGTRTLAEAYLKYLYSPVGQEIAAKHYYRPSLPEIAEKYKDRFAKIELFTIDDVFGGWNKAQAIHFNEKGVFDQIRQP